MARRPALSFRDTLLVLLGAGITLFLTSSTSIATFGTSSAVDNAHNQPQAAVGDVFLGGDPIDTPLKNKKPAKVITRTRTIKQTKTTTATATTTATKIIEKPGSALWPTQWIAPPPKQTEEVEFPPTVITHHAPGWTLFENVYMAHDTIYVVSASPNPKPEDYPQMRLMISRPLWASHLSENIAAREPLDGETMAFISQEEAKKLWGKDGGKGGGRVLKVEGNTVLVNEPAQFLNHFYHVIAELWVGIWVFWKGAHHDRSEVPPIHRLVLARTPSQFLDKPQGDGWHDKPGFNAFFLHGMFPSMSLEDEDDWNDRIAITQLPKDGSKGRVFHFETLMLTDRSASHRGHWTGSQNQRIAAEPLEYGRDKGLLGTKDDLARGTWWNEMRESVWRYVGADIETAMKPASQRTPTITYWSRQLSRSRKLRKEDHETFIQEMSALAERRGWIFNHVDAEKIDKDEQVKVVSTSDILIGVHGNGLSHLLFMPQSERSMVIELFYPGGFAHDYQWTSRATGLGYAAVWKDSYRTWHNKPGVMYIEGENGDGGFHGNNIPLDGKFVVGLVERRIDGGLLDVNPV